MKQEYAKVKKQQVLERVKTLTESDVGKKAFKGLTSEVSIFCLKFLLVKISPNCREDYVSVLGRLLFPNFRFKAKFNVTIFYSAASPIFIPFSPKIFYFMTLSTMNFPPMLHTAYSFQQLKSYVHFCNSKLRI